MACIITYNNKKYTQPEFNEYFKSHFFEFAEDFLGSKEDIEGFKNFVSNENVFYQLTSSTESSVNYNFKLVDKISNNLNKVKSLFNRLGDSQTFWNKLQQDLQIPKDQVELLRQSEGNTIEEKLASFAANYSYTVEINTAKEKLDDYDMIDRTGQGDFEPVEFEPDTDLEIIEDEDGNPIGTRIVLSEKGKKQIEERENKRRPTQHYSDLTVPGGTKYTENEIATPDIIPSIKGHAQFATDNGIGWFRSDEVSTGEKYEEEGVIENEFVEPTKVNIIKEKGSKTRRILEVQSDLFQKGRDIKSPDEIIEQLKKEGKLQIKCD